MTYNLRRHIELLKRSEDLKNQGKSFYRENIDDYLELSKYDGSFESYVSWKNRTQLLLLLDNYVNKIISGEEFSDSLFEFRENVTDECDNLLKVLSSSDVEDFELDARSKGFGSLISFIRAECDNFSDDYQNEEFYQSMKDCFLKLQKALNEE